MESPADIPRPPRDRSGTERVRKEIRDLSDRLLELQYAYYVTAAPLVSDLEYDRLFDTLTLLEEQYPEYRSPDSPTSRVGSDLTSELPEARHTLPVLSLDKAYTAEAVTSWMEKTSAKADRDLSFVVEEKIDGISIVLYYEEGTLTRAVTRGNGYVGNDVTANVRTIGAVPLRLPEPVSLAVRGEIYLPLNEFASLNAAMEIPYANPRNLVAGAVRRVKSSETASFPLTIFVYEGFFQDPVLQPPTHTETLAALTRLKFRLNPSLGLFGSASALTAAPEVGRIGRLEEVPAYLAELTRSRRERPYEIDGLVIKVNEYAVRESLGYTGHHPRWAVAFKFDAPQAQSIVRSIDVQVGRTGRITPVARIEPVQVGGTTVSNVTLHNQDYIDSLELAPGDLVAVSRRGDVIPAIERVLEKGEGAHPVWQLPSSCPTCGSLLERRGAHTFCPNPDCPDQVFGRLTYFVGKGQMDIPGVGPETIDALVRLGKVRDIPDLYMVDYHSLADVAGFGPKKIAAIIEGIEESKHQPFSQVLASLGIPDIARKVAETLVKGGMDSIDTLLTVAEARDSARLEAIPGIGPLMATSLMDWLAVPENRERIERLRAVGLQLAVSPEEETAVGWIAGMDRTFADQTWCVTGSFVHFNPRSLALKEIEHRGGRTVSSVTGKTTHLLAGQGAGSKLSKALELGVVIVTEEEFLKRIGYSQERPDLV